jgi:hypothetical protein
MQNTAFFAQIIAIFLLLKGIGEDGKQGLRVENITIFFLLLQVFVLNMWNK